MTVRSWALWLVVGLVADGASRGGGDVVAGALVAAVVGAVVDAVVAGVVAVLVPAARCSTTRRPPPGPKGTATLRR